MSVLPNYLYEDIFEHLDFHALIRLRRADPVFSDVVDPLLKKIIAQKIVKNLKSKIVFFGTQWRLLQMFAGMADLRYSA